MKTYTATVKMPSKEIDRINRLLSIICLDDLTDKELHEAGANTHHHEGVFAVKFEDGSSMTYDLCSGTLNYYDDVVFTSPDGYDTIIDCEFEFPDVLAVEINGNLYEVRIEKGD